MSKKIRHGQFYTIRNPFFHPAVKQWVAKIPELSSAKFVEPFAGANNIIKTFTEAFPEVTPDQWRAYDLHPEEQGYNVLPQVQVLERDTIAHPVPADVIVTNPPYLAKYSASRKGLEVDFGQYVDLYEMALAATLSAAPFVAAIIPETFSTRKLFRERLHAFISIEEDLFEDTTFPVGLALWVPEPTVKYEVWVGKRYMGTSDELMNPLLKVKQEQLKVRFNEPEGEIALYAVDGGVSVIRFARGEVFAPAEIKHSSRIVTRLDVEVAGTKFVTQQNLDEFIVVANSVLVSYRQQTQDLFMTTFKGKRKDGTFRKRLDYKNAKGIIALALATMH